jgi:hypothetical protein
MMKLAATALGAVLLQASATFAGGLKAELDTPLVKVVEATESAPDRTRGPSLSSAEIAALQYHETAVHYRERLSVRCQTRAGIFEVASPRPRDTTCVVNDLPGFMLP